MYPTCVAAAAAIISVQFAFITNCLGGQPEYQVALYGYRTVDDEFAKHFCNGVIVHSRLLITPASCLYQQPYGNSTLNLMAPEMIVAETGSASIEIDEIFIAPQYDRATQENDVAILHLKEALPLHLTNDMSWIIIGDEDSPSEICMVNFYEEDNPIMQSVQLELFPAHECRNGSARSSDICSEYILPTCDEREEPIEHNEDRGTGLVCGSYVHGILSEVLPQSNSNQNDTNCSAYALKAFYTSLAPHISWIYNIMADEESSNIQQGISISSTPYSQKHRIESILQSSVIDTTSYNDRNNTESMNSSGLQGTCNLSVFLLETVVGFQVAYYKMI